MPVFWSYQRAVDRHPSISQVARWYFKIDQPTEPDRRPHSAELLMLAGHGRN